MRLEVSTGTVSLSCMATYRGELGAILLYYICCTHFLMLSCNVKMQFKCSSSAKHIRTCMLTGYRLFIVALALQSLYVSLQACSHLKRRAGLL